MSTQADEQRVRRAAARIGLWVGIASGIVIATGVGILTIVIVLTSRPEGSLERPPDEDDRVDLDHLVVDVDRVLPWVIVLGVVGVAILAVVAWLAARRAVGPLGEALRLQRNFVSDASHELRTPLTALDSRVQILQRRQSRGEPIDETIAELRHDTRVMADVLADLLMAAESEQASAGTADVGACVGEAFSLLRPRAEEQGVELRPPADGRMAVAIAPVTLTRLLVALGDNALQHSPVGGAVTIDARRLRDTVELRVSDQGGGILAEDRERIFERFARGGESGQQRGFGLGLALVRDVASRSGGTITLEQSTPAGSTFLLRLPARDSDGGA